MDINKSDFDFIVWHHNGDKEKCVCAQNALLSGSAVL